MNYNPRSWFGGTNLIKNLIYCIKRFSNGKIEPILIVSKSLSKDELKEFTELEFHRVDSTRHNYHLLVARFIDKKRDTFIEKMSKKGVQCVVQYYPLNRYDFYRKAGYGDAKCPSADNFYDNMVSFPFSEIMDDDKFETTETTDTTDTQGNSTTFTLEDEISHARSNSTAMSTIEDRSTSN